MKYFFVAALALLSISTVSSQGQCGTDSLWEPIGTTCKYRCTPNGVDLECSPGGCQCVNFEHYYNLDTKSCSEVNCDNMNCAGRENEQFFKGCESGSRDVCGRSGIATADCRQGCMCKDGFCRVNGKCVSRSS